MRFRLICHMTINMFFWFWGGYPPPWGGGSRVIPGQFWFMIWKYKSEPISMKKISFLSHSVWTCSPEKNSYKKTIFRSFSAADGQMSGQMSIQLTYLSRAFHVLSIDMSHDPERVFLIFGVVTPPLGGGHMSSPANFDSWYENISQNQCRCRKTASYLIWCGHAPLKKTVIKKTIFRPFSGHFQLLTVKWVVKWAFNWHICIELFMCFWLICHMTQNVFF